MRNRYFSVLIRNKIREGLLNKAISEFRSQRALAQYLSKKLNKKIIREQVKDWKKARHTYGWNLYIPIIVLKELCKIAKCDVNYILKYAVRYNPPWFDPDKKRMLVKEKSMRLANKKGVTYLDLSTVLPNKTLHSTRSMKKLPLFVNVGKHRIRLWSEACWKKSIVQTYLFVKLDELFFRGAALYAGEGNTYTKSGHNSSISLGNTEPAIIKNFLKWINSLTLGNIVVYSIDYNGTLENKLQLIDYWSKILPDLPNKVHIRYRPNLKSGLINNFGMLRISIKNTVLKPFILNIVNSAKKLALTKKEWAIFYLRGLLAAEGSVYSKERLKAVTIGSTNPAERKFISQLLEFLELKHTMGKFQLTISDWNSFVKLYKYDALQMSQSNNYSKKERFISGLKLHAATKKFLDLKNFENKRFTSNDWKELCNLKFYNSASRFLNKLTKSNLLISFKDKNKNIYEINKEKLTHLESL